jgi:UDP-glucose 4-epimerase
MGRQPKMVSRVLITGASGFIGKSLCDEATRRGLVVSAVMRKPYCLNAQGVADVVFVETIDQKTDWGTALEGVDVVFHLAARVHVMSERANNPLDEFRKVNVFGTSGWHELRPQAELNARVLVPSV